MAPDTNDPDATMIVGPAESGDRLEVGVVALAFARAWRRPPD